jgi:hypothetical protein
MSGKTRSLKIEAVGDFACYKIKPRIRLAGYWLELAGFKPGHRVEIHSSKAGELTLQFKDQSAGVSEDSHEQHSPNTPNQGEADDCRDEQASTKLVLAKFRLGHIVTTPNALAELTESDILSGIQRHQAGDWGDLGNADKEANDRALENRARIVSAHHAANGTKFILVTEADRSKTTVFLSGEY